MSRLSIPFATDDMSALAKSLRSQLAEREGLPGHVELLNMLSRATGRRNFQHLRAQLAARDQLAAPAAAAEPVDHLRVARTARQFDVEGRLTRWPSRPYQRQLCLWVLWSAIPRGETFSEKGISSLLDQLQRFGDHALMRRALVDNGLLFRTDDCRIYQRIERKPPAEALALIQHLRSRAV